MDCEKLSRLLFRGVDMTREQLEQRYPPRELKEGAVVSRMAPSPTGFVHLGNLIQGLTAERICRQSDGVLFLRIEDTDAKREIPGAVETLISSLRHYAIEFDEGASGDGEHGDYGPYSQRARKDIYHVFARELVLKGMAYPCFCTEKELEEMREQQQNDKASFGYYGKWALWRDRPIEDIKAMLEKGAPYVLRFKSSGSVENKIKFNDLIKGTMELSENDIDYVLLKSDGIPTYHFAHVIDDHFMRTTHVVRGDEWISTLPFHLQLFSALGFRPPKYLHIGPLMKMDGGSKRKLSKRKDPELALTYYEAQGYPVQSVYEYLLGVLNSNFEDWRRANLQLNPRDFKFSYKKMNPAGALFDRQKLDDVSKNVISAFTAQRLVDELTEWAAKFDLPFYELLEADVEYARGIFQIGRGGKKPRKDIAMWSQAKDYCAYFYDELFAPCDCFGDFSDDDIIAVLEAYCAVYDEKDDNAAWFDKVKSICAPLGFSPDVKAYKQAPEQYKGHVGDVSSIIRVAVTGRTNTPDLCEIMKLLGSERSHQRLRGAINALKNRGTV